MLSRDIKYKKPLLALLAIILLSFLFVYHKQDTPPPKFTLLYTEDYWTPFSKAYLVDFDAEGRIVQSRKIKGALFYNLLVEDDHYLIDNGTVNYEISEQDIKKQEYDEVKGFFELGDYFYAQGELVKIYNVGFEDATTYHTRIVRGDKSVTVQGFLETFVTDESYATFIFHEMPDYGYPTFIGRLDYENFTFEKIAELPLNENYDYTFYEELTMNGSFVGFESEIDEDWHTIKENLILVPLDNPTQISSYSLDFFFEDNYNSRTFFNYEDQVFVFDHSGQLCQLVIDAEKQTAQFEKRDLQLPDFANSFYHTKVDGNKLTILDASNPAIFYQVDLDQMVVEESLTLEKFKHFDNTHLYSYYLHP